MLTSDATGFQYLSTINRLDGDVFERLQRILADRTRWEPLHELEENQADDAVASREPEDDWHAPLRENALRSLLARNLSLIEPGLMPFDENHGAEEFSVGEAGRIDLFLKDAKGNPVVVELKRDGSSDQVVGQLTRYMGFVADKYPAPGLRVRGIIIAHALDERLRLALKVVPTTEVRTYTVNVELKRA
jgi:RecB family endonuclease NucS